MSVPLYKPVGPGLARLKVTSPHPEVSVLLGEGTHFVQQSDGTAESLADGVDGNAVFEVGGVLGRLRACAGMELLCYRMVHRQDQLVCGA